MKKIRKLLPLSIYDIPGMERWLEEQANAGLFPVFLDSWATFTPTGVPGTRFRLEPCGKDENFPTAEQLELYRQAGWEYALTIGSVYFLFYTTDPTAVELYSDAQSRGLSLERLERRVQRAKRTRTVIYLLLAVALIWALFFFTSKFDVQPDKFAKLPLLLLGLGNPLLLLFLTAAAFLWLQYRRDTRILRQTCHALKEGLAPPPSPGPSKGILWENGIMLALLPPLLVLTVVSTFHTLNPLENIPLHDFERPYVAIETLEDVPVLPWEELFDEPPLRDQPENYATVNLSVLSPTWYTVTQAAYSTQSGEQANVFSPDPENGKYRYAPGLDMTCFSLLIPALARPVAKSQLDEYRPVNLRWSYQEVDHPGLDFVILADEPDGVWQMAALGKGGRVAVFRYAGAERLSDHLEQLSTMVQ